MSTKTQKKMGRPKAWEPTEKDYEMVEKLASVLTQAQLADIFGISQYTFKNYLKTDDRLSGSYKKGKATAISAVGTSLLRQARAGNITAMIFYLKTQAGWRDKVEVEHSGNPEIVVRTE